LAITRPLQVVHLVDSRLKRATFLRHLRAKLELHNVSVHHARFEELISQVKSADWITIQAVALTPALLANLRRASISTTKIVWITARASIPVAGAAVIRVPASSTEAWIFSLDHS
jgi:16S rRNA G527 N7-methylase RsmG